MADLAALYKKNAGYIIWTILALVAGLLLLLSKSCTSSSPKRPKQRATVSISLDILQGAAADAAERFLELCRLCEVYTFSLEVDGEATKCEQRTLELLASIGAFEAGLKRHRVMFSSTLAGRGSMVRQLQPSVHLDSEKEVVDTLLGKVNEVRLCGSGDLPSAAELGKFVAAVTLGGQDDWPFGASHTRCGRRVVTLGSLERKSPCWQLPRGKDGS
eukprot:s1891_g13.t1